jgi:hypothetical protein
VLVKEVGLSACGKSSRRLREVCDDGIEAQGGELMFLAHESAI